MPVPSLITDLSTTISSNSPAGSENVGTSMDDYIRALSAFIAQLNSLKANSASPTFTGTVTVQTITASAQPAFVATSTGAVLSGTANERSLTTVFDVASNLTSPRFIAPSAGVYLFTVNVSLSGAGAVASLRVNGSTAAYPGNFSISQASSPGLTATFIVQLNASDYVSVWCNGNGTTDTAGLVRLSGYKLG